MEFALIYAPEVVEHLRSISARWHRLIRATVVHRLSHGPLKEDRNRKPLRRPTALDEAWELRFGPQNRFRVFYRANESSGEVLILAVGEKRGDRLFIAGEEFAL